MSPGSFNTMRLSATVLLLVASCTACTEDCSQPNPYYTYFISPLVVQTPPPLKLYVRFSSEEVNFGNKIAAYSASIPPYIYYDAEPDKLYCIVAVDVDNPSAGAPMDAQFLHAMVVNIKGNNFAGCDYMTSWYPVTPYTGSGFHRYLILLYKQPYEIDITTPEMQNRHLNLTNFSVQDFASRYELGEPIAGNFFLSQLIVCDSDGDSVKQLCLQ